MSKKRKRRLRREPWGPLHHEIRELCRPEPVAPAPPEVRALIDQLRHIENTVIDLNHIYEIKRPDGVVHEATGAELVKLARDAIALFEASEAGDIEGCVQVLRGMGLLP